MKNKNVKTYKIIAGITAIVLALVIGIVGAYYLSKAKQTLNDSIPCTVTEDEAISYLNKKYGEDMGFKCVPNEDFTSDGARHITADVLNKYNFKDDAVYVNKISGNAADYFVIMDNFDKVYATGLARNKLPDLLPKSEKYRVDNITVAEIEGNKLPETVNDLKDCKINVWVVLSSKNKDSIDKINSILTDWGSAFYTEESTGQIEFVYTFGPKTTEIGGLTIGYGGYESYEMEDNVHTYKYRVD